MVDNQSHGIATCVVVAIQVYIIRKQDPNHHRERGRYALEVYVR